jgi:hypothetical protein
MLECKRPTNPWPLGPSEAGHRGSPQASSGVSVGNALASAVSAALPLLGLAPGASQERQEVVRTATTRGSAYWVLGRTGVDVEVKSIGK